MYNKGHGENEAEFAILVTDQFQRKGLGTELLCRLIQFGHDEKLQRLTGIILAENQGALPPTGFARRAFDERRT